MIAVKNLHKSFGKIKVLKGIDATFEKGKTNLIIGKSGSGKTVLLKNIIGLLKPEQGQIFFSNNNYATMDNAKKRQLRKDMGVVFQGNALFDSMNVFENIAFPLKMFGNFSVEKIKERVDFVLKRVNLKDVNKKLPSELSGGMQKRVAIARGIVMKPQYLLFDEPNSGLDPATSRVIDHLILEITKEYEMTTIINTHDMNSVMEMGKKIILLDNGEKIWEGDSKNILHSDNQEVINIIEGVKEKI